jgi:predicted nucleotidyltransferase component of viral defense system
MAISLDTGFMPDNTSKVYQKLASQTFISDFVLVGGTALSMQIKHRYSEDLDFIFDDEELNVNSIKRNIKRTFPDHRIIRQDHSWQIDFLVNDVKLTFFSAGAVAIPFCVKDYSFSKGKINIAELKVIGALKFSAIAHRNTIRDYYDLYYLTRHHLNLLELVTFTKKLFPNISPVTYTETLVYTKDIDEEDISSHLSPAEMVNKEQIAAFFTKELIKIKELL